MSSDPIQTHGRPRLTLLASFSGAGGVERMLINLLRAMVGLGRELDLLTIRTDSPHLDDLPEGVRHIDLGVRHSHAAIAPLARHLRRTRPPVLLAAKDRAGRAAVQARRRAGVATPIVLRLGTNLSAAMAHKHPLQRWLRYRPIRRLYPQLAHIVAVSAGVAADTAQLAHYPRERISVIRNPVITPALAANAAAPCPHPWLEASARARVPVIIGAGRLERQKDFPTLVRAFAELRRARPCRLLLLGEGGSREQLVTLARQLQITADLDMPGFQANPHAWLSRANLFVLSSAWEGSPNVLTEALALGTPVVATDCPSGPREILADGRIAPLVPVGDVPTLAAAMARVLDAPPPPETLIAAVDAYRAEVSAAAYMALLDAVAAGDPPATRRSG
jgi:glycosyltransferase involved in cell wall biosynthesis